MSEDIKKDAVAEPRGAPPPEKSGEGKQRWPRRRLLRWALGLVPLTAGGGWAALQRLGGPRRVKEEREHDGGPVDGWRAGMEEEGPPKTRIDPELWAAQRTQEAAWLCFAGHQKARANLFWAIKISESYAPAHLMYACWLLGQERRLDLMREELSVPGVKDTLEARLLLELAERRAKTPGWRHAFFDAWNALGRPDFSESPLLPEPLEVDHPLPYTLVDWEQAEDSQRFPLAVLALGELSERLEWGRDQVRASTSVPLLMALREQLLPQDTQVPQRQFLLPVVEERLGQLAGPAPRTLQLALRAFLAGGSPEAPFERRDLESLEQLVTLEWKQPSSEEFYLEMCERLEGLLLIPHHHAWLLATSAQGVSLGRELLRRAKASKAHLLEDEQRWMGRLLWEVGARLREQRSRLELEMGLLIQVYGSELTGHSPTRWESIGLWMELGEWEKALKRAAYYRWPLAALQEESCQPRARDEHAWMRAFAGKGELP